jgi:hypothetical protein
MKVYISGKIAGEDFDTARAKFKEAEDLLQQAGFETVNPLEMCLAMGISGNVYKCMRADIKALLECDVIYMLPDWWDSRGAKLEHEVAYRCGIAMLSCEYCVHCFLTDGSHCQRKINPIAGEWFCRNFQL